MKNSRKIFIIEDERIVALDLQHRLARLGHEIVGNVSSGDEALKQIPDAKADLVLTDIRLGGNADGIELADAVHNKYRLPVIFVTAYSDDKTLERVKASSACGFIIKPFTDEELQVTIEIGLHEHEFEMKLRQSEEQYRRLFNDAPVGYHEIDCAGRLTRVNRTELEMLGYTAADMIGRPVWDFLRESGVFRKAVMEKLSSGKISDQPFERNYLRRDGRIIPVLIKDYPICSSDGKLIGIRTTIQDISRLKEEQTSRMRLEANLRRADKLESLAAMAGGLAHELNNQLMAIQGNTALALFNQPPEAGEARGYLQSILAACQRSSKVINQLLVCAGMDKGAFARINLSEIVTELLPSLRSLVAGKAELRLSLAKNLPPVNGGASQLKQLLTILVTNSLEAIQNKNGVIQIETGADKILADKKDFEIILRDTAFAHPPFCYLSVTDTGLGMDDETRSKLFDPFFTTKGIGRGLGLSTVSGIVKNHDGNIMVKSVPGRGTTVRIVLPCDVVSSRHGLLFHSGGGARKKLH